MLHSCRMLCSDKHGTFSPALLVDASTTLAKKTVEHLLHLEFLWAGMCWRLTEYVSARRASCVGFGALAGT